MKRLKRFEFVINILSIVGKYSALFFVNFGKFVIFFKDLIASSISRQVFFQNIRSAIFINGFCSIPVVGLTGIFTGAVLTVQLYYSLSKFGVQDTIPAIVLIALLKELGPVLCGLMVVARVGSSMVAELGGMVVNNQIDSLIAMSISPFRFLYIPRTLALTLSMPFLMMITATIGVIGSFVIAVSVLDFSPFFFINALIKSFDSYDLLIGLIKATVFGFVISVVSCYKGSTTKDGSYGIGQSTISAVVSCCVYVLFLNFVITYLMAK